jgi:hypothetical protein
MTLSKRESRIAWGFLLGVTLSEGLAVAWSFSSGGSLIKSLWHYGVTPPGTPLAWICATAVMVTYVAYSASRSPVIALYAFNPAAWLPVWGLRLFSIPMALVTGFFEEAFFRKSIMDSAQHHGFGVMSQVMISALIFGVAHAIWGVFGGKVRAAVAVMLTTSVLGGLLALVYLIGGRSVGPCMAAHIGLNLFLEPWMVISSATGSWGKRSMRESVALV